MNQSARRLPEKAIGYFNERSELPSSRHALEANCIHLLSGGHCEQFIGKKGFFLGLLAYVARKKFLRF